MTLLDGMKQVPAMTQIQDDEEEIFLFADAVKSENVRMCRDLRMELDFSTLCGKLFLCETYFLEAFDSIVYRLVLG
jgi:hypothetical protein